MKNLLQKKKMLVQKVNKLSLETGELYREMTGRQSFTSIFEREGPADADYKHRYAVSLWTKSSAKLSYYKELLHQVNLEIEATDCRVSQTSGAPCESKNTEACTGHCCDLNHSENCTIRCAIDPWNVQRPSQLQILFPHESILSNPDFVLIPYIAIYLNAVTARDLSF